MRAIERWLRCLRWSALTISLCACQLSPNMLVAPTDSAPSPSVAGQWYVSPTGAPVGDGSLSRPWDLITALSHPAKVRPGDTIWVRGGIYKSPGPAGFSSHLQGAVASPITVRNYQRERATLDGNGAGTVLLVYGSNTWYWGLEITDSSSARSSTTAGSFSNPRAAGVASHGAGNKFINMIVHNAASGFGGGADSPDTEYYGNLIYYNGWIGPDRRHGHGFYLQNQSGMKLANDNIVGDNAEEGFQIYGSSTASLVGIHLFGNVTYNTSSWPTPNYQYNYILEGGGVSKDIRLANAYSYFTPAANYGFILFALNDISVTDSVFVGGQIGVNFRDNAGPVVFTGNRVYNQPTAPRELTVDSSSQARYNWDHNVYYGNNNFYASGSVLAFTGWQRVTSFDTHSTFTAGIPTGAWVYIRSNKYEPKRANIIIFNWPHLSAVSVDLSGIFSIGDRFRIQDAQNFFGPAVASGTYSGAAIAIPLLGLTKEIPIGFSPPAHTAPEFGTFVVMSN